MEYWRRKGFKSHKSYLDYLKNWRRKNALKVALYKKEWKHINKDKVREYQRKWNKTEKGKESKKRYRIRNRIKYLAREKLRRAVKLGKIKRGDCLVCGWSITQAHHEDYSQPLNVIWLCEKHHNGVHNWIKN